MCSAGNARRSSLVPGGRRVGYRRGQLLWANEKSFLRALDVALGRDYRPFAQVRLGGLRQTRHPARATAWRDGLDFVICDGLSLDPVVAIEVDEVSRVLPNG